MVLFGLMKIRFFHDLIKLKVLVICKSFGRDVCKISGLAAFVFTYCKYILQIGVVYPQGVDDWSRDRRPLGRFTAATKVVALLSLGKQPHGA